MAYQLTKKLQTKADFIKAGLSEAELVLIDDDHANPNYAYALQRIIEFKITPFKAAVTAPVAQKLHGYGIIEKPTATSAKQELTDFLMEHPACRHDDPGLAFLKILYYHKFAKVEEKPSG